MKIRTLSLTREEYTSHTKPAVYELYKGDVCLYIGYAMRGFNRLFDNPKNHINRYQAFKEADRFEISFYDSKEEAIIRERELILEKKPLRSAQSNLWTPPKNSWKIIYSKPKEKISEKESVPLKRPTCRCGHLKKVYQQWCEYCWSKNYRFVK